MKDEIKEKIKGIVYDQKIGVVGTVQTADRLVELFESRETEIKLYKTPDNILVKEYQKLEKEIKQLQAVRECAKMIDWKYLIWFLTDNANPYEPEKGDRPTREMIMVGDLKELQQVLAAKEK